MSATRSGRWALLLLWLGPGAWAAAPPDCQFTLAPQRCELYRQGVKSCSDLFGGARRSCLREFEPPLRCHGRNRESCQALTAAQQRCDALDGAERRSCILPDLPPCRAFTRSAECRR